MNNHRRKIYFSLIITASFLIFGGSANADVIEPGGVFFHSYTGPFSAVEWIHFRSQPGSNRYQFSDIRGLAPYEGVILDSGEITWDNTGTTSGSGMFSSQNDATMTLNYFGGEYQSTLRRAPATDSNFITRIESRVSGDSIYAGQWNLSVEDLDSVTGALLNTRFVTAMIDVNDDSIRLTYDDGTWFQGVFEDPDHAGFRVVLPNGGLTDEFASFDGSETSLSSNLLGDLQFESSDEFSATWLTQTRTTPGQQQQFVQRIQGIRAVPEPDSILMLALASLGMLACRRTPRPTSPAAIITQ